MAANIGLQYATELLPTPVRAQGVALVHLFGILAHAVAPYITDLVRFVFLFNFHLFYFYLNKNNF